jgi:ribosomal protein S12 methylthiotransferase
MLLTAGHTAYVKIAEGCSHACEFCAIPAIKGPMVSRSPDSIRREVEDLVRRGVREISIIAQDPAAYSSKGCRLPGLVESLAAAGIDWMRLLYIHPASARIDELARIFEIPQVCRYMDIPVQHASNRILARMKRGHRIEAVARLLEEIRRICPDMVFRSEVITGYPGESEDDFELLKEWVESAGIATLGIFIFSPEPGTPAFERDDLVPPEVSAERHAELLSAHEAFAFGFHSGYIGRTLEVLVDRTLEPTVPDDDECSAAGRYYGQALEIDGEVFLRPGEFQPGQFVTARIVDTTIHDLVGEVGEKA